MFARKTHLILISALFAGIGNLHADKEARLKRIDDKERAYWFFQPLANPTAPKVKNSTWAKNEEEYLQKAKDVRLQHTIMIRHKFQSNVDHEISAK